MISKSKVACAVALLGLLALSTGEANYEHEYPKEYGHGPDSYGIEGHHYDDEVYDQHGYDKYGFDKNGYDKDGYHQHGYHQDGYDSEGYDKYGFKRDGYNSAGYHRSRYFPYTHGQYDKGYSHDYGHNATGNCPPALACPAPGSSCGTNSSCCNGFACHNNTCCAPIGSNATCTTPNDCCQYPGNEADCVSGRCVKLDLTCGGVCVLNTAFAGANCWCAGAPCPGGLNPCRNGVECQANGRCACFPASSTVRRLAKGVKLALEATGVPHSTQLHAQLSKAGRPSSAVWETVTMPELRVGDFVECVVRQAPGWLGSGSTAKSMSGAGQLDVCQVYNWKAAPQSSMEVQVIEFKYPDGSVGTLKASANHHFYSAAQAVAPDAATPTIPPGGVKHTGHVTTADVVTTRDPATGLFYTLPVESVTTEKDVAGVYAPYLTKGGLLVVDGAVMYPSATSPQNPANEDKHWGRYYLMAPLWQAVEEATTSVEASAAGDSDIAAAWGMRLYDLGDKLSKEVPLLDKQWYAVAEAAGAESSVDWRGLAKELHTAIAVEGRRVSRADVLRVLRKHMVRSAGGTATM